MLKQILKAGYVDPELLEMLTEEQKDLIFMKMREEQVRKWNEREAMLTENPVPAKKTEPKIKFRTASDGNPWVWVMGAHADDLSYEEMILKREKEKEEQERERLRKEAEELAQHETRDILLAPVEKLEKTPGTLARTESVMDSDSGAMSSAKSMKLWQKAVGNRSQLIRRMSGAERAEYEKRRADELYENMLQGAETKKKRIADFLTDFMVQWQKSEQSAKEYEERRRRASIKMKQKRVDQSSVDQVLESALPEEKKQALRKKLTEQVVRRDELSSSPRSVSKAANKPKKLTSSQLKMFRQASDADVAETRPKSMEHAIRWFKESEKPKGVGMDLDGCISLWFHGDIGKAEAERILIPKPPGMFLLRISNKVWGYSVSVRTSEKVKHYVLLATEGKYRFVGNNQPEFNSLAELLKYYKYNPITWAGQEILLLPCEQTNEQLKTISVLFEDEGGTAM